MLFGVTSIVRWVIGPSPISRMIPQIHAELLIVGATVAILIAGLILSPTTALFLKFVKNWKPFVCEVCVYSSEHSQKSQILREF